MIRVLIVPAPEAFHFQDVSLIARGGAIVAIAGNTSKERIQSAFDSEDAFLDTVARGAADLHTFDNDEEATEFATAKIESLNEKARRIEEAMRGIAPVPAKRIQPAESRPEPRANKIA